MAQLEITNVINISVSAAPVGLGNYNTSNIGLFTREVPGLSFGAGSFKLYKSPSEVIKDFGSSSVTGAMANAIFSQKPNILAGSGYLAVIPMLATGGTQPAVTAIQKISFSTVPTVGTYVLNYLGNPTSAINWNDNAAAVQGKLQAVAGLATVTVTGDTTNGFFVTFTGVSGNAALLVVSSASTLLDGLGAQVFVTVVTSKIGVVANCETLDAAITRTKDVVQYFGILSGEIELSAQLLAAAAVVQPLNKILFVASKTAADVNPGGLLDELRTGSFDQTRGLLYIGSAIDSDSVVMASAYAGRALSTDFSGSNTTQTMHLKDLVGVQPDSSMTQTILEAAKVAGADVYVSIQGVPKVFCTKGNTFFDRVYNRQAFVGALQIAGFNALATSSTKVPQTEPGMGTLKGAYRKICDQYVGNQYIAPGSWNSPDTFGVLADFLANVTQKGYYIFSSPVALQSQADREARVAPLVQIAVKEAGAIQSSNVLIFINP